MFTAPNNLILSKLLFGARSRGNGIDSEEASTRSLHKDLLHKNNLILPKLLFGARSGGNGIDSEEAKRSPLSSHFHLMRGDSKKCKDNSDRKNDPLPERTLHKGLLHPK
ncbi:hypothetical protein AB9M62_40940 [Bacillales bacterium AN1005]